MYHSLPSDEELNKLRQINRPYCLSIYLKTNSFSPASSLAIELKNRVRQAKIALIDIGLDYRQIKKILRPIEELINFNQYWPKLNSNLVIFSEANFFEYFYLEDNNFEDKITIANQFEIEPLIQIINNNPHYFILELAHKKIHLLEGDKYRLNEVHLKNLPTDMEKDLKIDEYPQSWQSHTIAPVRSTDSQAYHEQYNVKQTDKLMLKIFFRLIDKSLINLLNRKQKPLILAGVNYLIPIYKSINSYPRLMNNYIKGNQQTANKDQLRRAALSILP